MMRALPVKRLSANSGKHPYEGAPGRMPSRIFVYRRWKNSGNRSPVGAGAAHAIAPFGRRRPHHADHLAARADAARDGGGSGGRRQSALSQWVGRVPDAVVLDLTLPGLDGLQVLQRARALGLRTPVLILTARGTVGDRVMGLNAGADDYLPKPFDLDELEARLRALVRRSADPGATPVGSNITQIGAIRYDKDSGALYLHGEVMELTRASWR